MFEQYENIVKQYDIQVYNSYKGRGALVLETDSGLKLLKEVQLGEGKLTFINELQGRIKEAGFNTDPLLRTKDGELYACDENKKFIIKEWIAGREVVVSEPAEILDAIRLLAKYHIATKKPITNSDYQQFDKTALLQKQLIRHNKELVRIRNGIKRMGRWSEFDLLFLENFNYFYDQAEQVAQEMTTAYRKVLEDYGKERVIVHGQYNHHNILYNSKNQLYILNFELAHYNLPVMDLYAILRKTEEKCDWDIKLGLSIVEAYINIHNLGINELDILIFLLRYPEKFWKISNFYFNLNKAWKPKQTWVKLKKLVAQESNKQRFIAELTAHLKRDAAHTKEGIL